MNIIMFLRKAFFKILPDSVYIWYKKLSSNLARKFWCPVKIMTPKDTVNYIIDTKCSIARFGDGELHIVAYGVALGFQRADDKLKKRLRQVLKNKNQTLLLCLPNRLNMISDEERKKLPSHWQKMLPLHFRAWTKHLPKKRLYGDTNLSRLTENSGYENTMAYIACIKQIWQDRNVIMVEGEKTRFGVGNDLLDNVRSLQRILGPAESAFDYCDPLLECCVNTARQVENPLIMLALGPTATVLACELADLNFQALDIGHLDISYEKFKSGNNDAVPGKYTNESQGGNIVDDCLDADYISQIVARIG